MDHYSTNAKIFTQLYPGSFLPFGWSPIFGCWRAVGAGDPPRASPTFEHAKSKTPPILIDQSDNDFNHEKETKVIMLKLTATQVEKLQKKANNSRKNEMGRGFTRYEVITAHIWRTACNVRNHKPEQATALAIAVNIRSKMRPPLPREYFGNAVIDAIATGCSGEIVSNPLGYTSSKIRDAIETVDDEHVNSVLEFLKGQDDLSKLRELKLTSNGGGFHGNPNIGVTSWLTLPIYDADFGWGKEIHMTPGTHDNDGDSLILNGKDGDRSLIVALCLQARHMEDFQKLFYQDIDVE